MPPNDIHRFDADGTSVLRRRQLEVENELLRSKLAIAERLLRQAAAEKLAAAAEQPGKRSH